LAFGLIFFEFLDIPPVHSVSVADTLPVYKWLGEQPGDFGIVVYPPDKSNYDLLAQRFHQKRFLNPKGRTPAEVQEVVENLNTPEAVENLRNWGVRYVVLRQGSTLGLESNYELIETYGRPKVYLLEVPGE